MEKIDYLDFIKQLTEIKDMTEKRASVEKILIQNTNLDLEMATVKMAFEDLEDLDSLFDDSQPITEYYMKKSIIFFEIIKNYTLLDVKDNDIVENYNIELEELLKENIYVKRIFDSIKTIYENDKIKVVQEFAKVIKNLPAPEEVEKMANDFQQVFDEGNKENLEILQDIVSYNDPAMKNLKDTVYSAIPKQEETILDNEIKKE